MLLDLAANLSDTEFESEGRYFLRLDVTFDASISQNDSSPGPSTSFVRTEVDSTITRTPQFDGIAFHFTVPRHLSEEISRIAGKVIPVVDRGVGQITVTAFSMTGDGDGGGGGDAPPFNNVGGCLLPLTLASISVGSETSELITLRSGEGYVVGTVRLHLKWDRTDLNEQGNMIFDDDDGFGRLMLMRSFVELTDDAPQALGKGGNIEEDLAVVPKPDTYDMFISDSSKSEGRRIVFTIHDAWDLPMIANASTNQTNVPVAFVSVKSLRDAEKKLPAKATTRTAKPAIEASFGEVLVLEIPESYSQNHSPQVFVSISDSASKRYLAKFILPIDFKQCPPYRQLTLVLRAVSSAVGLPCPQLRISITSIDNSLSKPSQLQKYYSKRMFVLECVLKGITKSPLPFAARCIAVLRAIPNSKTYLSSLISKLKKDKTEKSQITLSPAAQLDFDSSGRIISNYPLLDITVPFLKTDNKENSEADRNNKQIQDSYYQMTASSKFDVNPVWNKHFVFALDATDCSDAALIIEFYRDPPISQKKEQQDGRQSGPSGGASRPISDIFGYSTIPLQTFTTADAGKIRSMDSLPVRIFHPYSQLPGSENVICAVDIRIPEQWGLPIRNGGLKKTENPIERETGRIRVLEDGTTAEFDGRPQFQREQTAPQSFDEKSILVAKLTKEVDARGDAIRRIGQDLTICREQNSVLEARIKELENEKRDFENQANIFSHSIDLDVITRPELEKRYSLLSAKLLSQVGKTKKMTETIHRLQNSNIERNNLERDFLELRQAHTAQQEVLHRLQACSQDSSGLKSTIKKQEEVIAKLESLVRKSRQAPHHDVSNNSSMNESAQIKSLIEENEALKQRVQELESQNHDRKDAVGVSFKEEDYLNALLKAETNEVRVAALESELLKNAKSFAQQLAEAKAKILEYERGQSNLNDMEKKYHLKPPVTPPINAHPTSTYTNANPSFSPTSKVKLGPITNPDGSHRVYLNTTAARNA